MVRTVTESVCRPDNQGHLDADSIRKRTRDLEERMEVKARHFAQACESSTFLF